MFFGGKPELHADTIDRVLHDIKFNNDYERNIAIAFDEIKVKEGLVYSTEDGKLIGSL